MLGDEQPYFRHGCLPCRIISALPCSWWSRLWPFPRSPCETYTLPQGRVPLGCELPHIWRRRCDRGVCAKKKSGIAVLNVGCLYQHSPLKYQKPPTEKNVHGRSQPRPSLSKLHADELRTSTPLMAMSKAALPAPRALLAPHCTKQEMVTQPHPQ